MRGTAAGRCSQRLFADDVLLQILLPGERARLRQYPHPNPSPAGEGLWCPSGNREACVSLRVRRLERPCV
ncbi:hypothetical protein XAP7430_480069 [Xanthomonas phaseoli pv. phaseoli]|uniref:Uncharacterized protein n=1 Tax=Xanthomonas campestris pv. phaseoli TaxID=317013 RepID=A0AB38E3T3_XANCH|nr:hypothetical protein XAP6984_520021 [Xanthomonas phaseoli pv. phaseoli]SON90499.1 hypothetical protein XAP7430_480069 [Xanthomonas phaseoli pv. phaseoli]